MNRAEAFVAPFRGPVLNKCVFVRCTMSWIVLIGAGVVVLGGAFALIFWLLGRGHDDDSTS